MSPGISQPPRANDLISLLEEQVERNGDREALRSKQDGRWTSTTWREWHERSGRVAAGLIEQGLAAGDRVALFSGTRKEWVEADMGILMAGGITVTVYHNLSPASAGHILRDSQASFLFIEGPLQMRTLSDRSLQDVWGSIRGIVYFSLQPSLQDGRSDLTIHDLTPEELKPRLVSFEELLRRGKNAHDASPAPVEERRAQVGPDTIARIVYTSGTTDHPKGAMLRHRNFVFVTESLQEVLRIRPTDLTMLFLPLAHVYALLVVHTALRVGYAIAFAESPRTVVKNCEETRPDFIATVPMLFEKIHAEVMLVGAGLRGFRRRLFDWAIALGKRFDATGAVRGVSGAVDRLQLFLARRLVWPRLRRSLGGRVRFIISGGAPLSLDMARFFHAAGFNVLEGYGMTENASLSNVNRPGRFRLGTVGQLIPGVECRIAEDGEILFKGGNLMAGYWNRPEDTREAVGEDGWLHTGDIGRFIDAEFLEITDRKKDILITAGGKNIAPQPIEHLLKESLYINHAMVCGDRRSFLTALVTLDLDAVRRWARGEGLLDIERMGLEALCRDGRVRALVDTEVTKINARVDPFQTVKRFVILAEDFSIERGDLTPTLKVKRREVEKRYADLIESMYNPSE